MSVTIETTPEVDRFLEEYARIKDQLGGAGPGWRRSVRDAAIERFAELGFPTRRDEAWRHTSVAPLTKIAFKAASFGETPDVASVGAEIEGLNLHEPGATLLVFVNGGYRRELSIMGELPRGVKVGSLADAANDDPELIERHLTRYASFENHPFVALNTAFWRDGAFVFVPKGVLVERPVYLMHVSTAAEGEPIVSHPRCLIVAEESSELTVVETYQGRGEEVYFTNAVTELVLGENAVVDHYKVQLENENAFHIATIQAHLNRSSNLRTTSISVGGGLVRNDVNAVLDGEGIECVLDGLTLADGTQLVDNHTRLDHAKPHCESHELYKGIFADRATGIFNGRIVVAPDAQKTDAKQSNRNLLLSETATIETQPQLEIFANDVKCTHGATVGQLDAEAMFYLLSRGIPPGTARALLIYAFANEMIERIKIESLRDELERMVFARFDSNSS